MGVEEAREVGGADAPAAVDSGASLKRKISFRALSNDDVEVDIISLANATREESEEGVGKETPTQNVSKD